MTLNIAQFGHEQLVALVIATSFAAGLNVYATALTLGLLTHSGLILLPAPLALLGSWWVIGAMGALFAIEFVADKIPVVDLAWNALQTFVRVPAAAVFAFGATTSLSPGQQLLAATLGGLLAFAAHAGKIAARTAVTTSPEPFSNAALSLAEDAAAIGLTWFATSHPYIAASLVVVMVVLIIVAIRAVARAVQAVWRYGTRDVRRG